MLNATPIAHLPVPFEAIQEAITQKRPNRTDYLRIREAVVSWHRSVLGEAHMLGDYDGRMDNVNFVDYQLTKEEMQEADDWIESGDVNISDIVNEMLLEGYRFTFTYDVKNFCVVVSVMGKTPDNPNVGLCMSTRHGHVSRATALAVYKHKIIFSSNAWGQQGPEGLYG